MKNILREEKRERVVTFLDRKEVDFLDKFGKDALFSCGIKLSRAKLIAWLVDFIKELNLNGENIKTEKDFENRIIKVMGQTMGQFPPATQAKNEDNYEKPTS